MLTTRFDIKIDIGRRSQGLNQEQQKASGPLFLIGSCVGFSCIGCCHGWSGAGFIHVLKCIPFVSWPFPRQHCRPLSKAVLRGALTRSLAQFIASSSHRTLGSGMPLRLIIAAVTIILGNFGVAILFVLFVNCGERRRGRRLLVVAVARIPWTAHLMRGPGFVEWDGRENIFRPRLEI